MILWQLEWFLNYISPQVRIFGVTVLVAAWGLDAAAKGIPPTIPVVNFNTVMMRRMMWKMGRIRIMGMMVMLGIMEWMINVMMIRI